MWCGDGIAQTRSRDIVHLHVITLQPCAEKGTKAGRQGGPGFGVTAVLGDWMSQLLSLCILFCRVEVMRTERVARGSTRSVWLPAAGPQPQRLFPGNTEMACDPP